MIYSFHYCEHTMRVENREIKRKMKVRFTLAVSSPRSPDPLDIRMGIRSENGDKQHHYILIKRELMD